MEIEQDVLRRACWLAKLQFDQTWDGYSHPSHAAAKALEWVEGELDLPTFGVEGFTSARDCRKGVQYLNTGDLYDATVLCHTTASTATFRVGCWGDVVEQNPYHYGDA